MYVCIYASAAVCRTDMTCHILHATLDYTSAPMSLIQQPIRWVKNEAQFEQRLGRAHPIWTLDEKSVDSQYEKK